MPSNVAGSVTYIVVSVVSGATSVQCSLGFVLSTGADELVGECSIHAIDWRNGVAQIGVCIWQPGHRRQGRGQVAVQHMIRWGFDYLRFARIEAWVVDDNEPSLRLFDRLGFTHEGTLRQRYLYAGARKDTPILGTNGAFAQLTYLALQPGRNISLTLDYTNTDIAHMRVSALRPPQISQMPNSVPGRVISVEAPGWLMSRSGFAFTWTLNTELPRDERRQVA